MTTPIKNDEVISSSSIQPIFISHRTRSLPLSPISSVAQTTMTIASPSSTFSLEDRVESMNLQENKQKKIDRYGLRYPFLKVMLEETEKFDQFQKTFCIWGMCFERMDLKEVLGITKGNRPAFGKAKSIQDALEIYRKEQASSSPLENTPTQVFMNTFKDLEPENLTVCLNILSSLSDLKKESSFINSFKANMSNSPRSQKNFEEFELFNKTLMTFAVTCHNKFNDETNIFEKAHKDYLIDRQLILQAIIYLLKTLTKKSSCLFINLNENNQDKLASLLNQIRELHEGDTPEPIPFQLVAEYLNTVILNQTRKLSSESYFPEASPRIPTSKSLPDVKSPYVYIPSPTPRTSPILKRHYNKDGSFLRNSNKNSPSLNRHVPEHVKAPQFEIPLLKIPQSKDLELIKKILQSEKNSLCEGKQGELCIVNSKLDEKGVKFILKYLEEIVDPLMNLQDPQQQTIFNEILTLLCNHTTFKNLSKGNLLLYNAYIKINLRGLCGGALYTYEQIQIHRQDFLEFLNKNNIPKDLTADLYGQEILVYNWFHPNQSPPNSMLLTLSFLKSPLERFRIRVAEYNLNKRQYFLKLEPILLSIKSMHLIRSQYLHFSKQTPNDSEFILTVAKEIGLNELLKYIPELNSHTSFLENMGTLINLENKLTVLTKDENPTLKVILNEFSNEITEIKTYPEIFGAVILEIFLHLSTTNTTDASSHDSILEAILRAPYIQIASVLQLLNNQLKS